MKQKLAILALALTTLTGGALGGAPAIADVLNRTVEDSNQNDCLDQGNTMSDIDCAAAKRRSGYELGIAVKGNGKIAYAVDNVWIRVRKSNGSGSKDVARHKDNITADDFSLTEFHYADVAAKLSMSMAALQTNGFQIRPKIESLGAGSGRQDKCPVVSFRYSGGGWQWAKGDKPAASDFDTASASFVALYRAGGTVNNVKCSFKSAK